MTFLDIRFLWGVIIDPRVASENVSEFTKIVVNIERVSEMTKPGEPKSKTPTVDTLIIVLILIYFFMVSLCCTLWVSTLECSILCSI